MKSRTLALIAWLVAAYVPLAAQQVAHCHCGLASKHWYGDGPVSKGALNPNGWIVDFGDIKTYTACDVPIFCNPQSDANQNDCKTQCAAKETEWESQSTVCAAFQQLGKFDAPGVDAHEDALRAYSAVGTRDYDWAGHSIGPPPTSQLVVHPRYYLMSPILYALPGCDPTGKDPTGKVSTCSPKSSATYSNGTSTARTFSIQNSFTTAQSVTADASITFPLDVAKLGLSASSTNGYSVTSTSGSSETISKSSTTVLNETAATTDGIDHRLDQFNIFLNPAIVLTNDCVKYGNTPAWDLGISQQNGVTGFFMARTTVTACQILGNCIPSSPLPPDLVAANLTASDYCSILAQDPFVQQCAPPPPNVTLTPDEAIAFWNSSFNTATLKPPPIVLDPAGKYPGRYVPTGSEPPYNIPVSTLGCGSFGLTLSNSTQAGTSASNAQTSSSSSLVGASISVPDALSFGLKQTDSISFTNTVSAVNTETGTQTASANIACPGFGWNNAFDQVAIYWDNVYSSFLFYPLTFAGTGGWTRITFGNVEYLPATSFSPTPTTKPHLPVQLFSGGVVYTTSTDNQGNYQFFSSTIMADPLHPLPAKVSVGGVTVDVLLGSSTPTVVKVVAGDVNGDGKTDCADLAIVKTSFGKSAGQIGFDARADVNGDGVVDIRDLAFVAQQLPAGTRCP